MTPSPTSYRHWQPGRGRRRLRGRFDSEVKHRCWGHGWPSLPGLSPTREVPHGHHVRVHRYRHCRAGVHRARTACPGWVPSRLHRPDPRDLRFGPAPACVLVRAASAALVQARRADIECFARDLEARGRARATITRRLCTIAGFYRYAVEEEFLDHSPASHVRRPRLDYESHATGLDRNELGALLVAAGLGRPAELALNLAAGPQRATPLRGHRRLNREPGRRPRAPHLGAHAQGRQGGHDPARAADGAGDRPGCRRAQ
jgi:hypothetical protein